MVDGAQLLISRGAEQYGLPLLQSCVLSGCCMLSGALLECMHVLSLSPRRSKRTSGEGKGSLYCLSTHNAGMTA